MRKPLALLVVLVVSACGGANSDGDSSVAAGNQPSGTASDDPTGVTPTEPTQTSSGSDTNTPTTMEPGSDGAAAGATPTSAVITIEDGTTRELLRADAFDPGDWEEGSHQIAGKSEQIQAMAATLGCSGGNMEQIEFRFAETTGTLKVDVAQDMRSESSSGLIEFSLVVDGRQVQTKSIGFKETEQLTTDLANVTVVQIQAHEIGEDCTSGKSAVALITRAAVDG